MKIEDREITKPFCNDGKHRNAGGRPSKATPELLDALGDALRDRQRHKSKAAAAQSVGISLATLFRWQHHHPCLREAWEAANPLYQGNAEGTGKKRARAPKAAANRQIRLICWMLVHRVRALSVLTETHERKACERVNMTVEAWQAARIAFPGLMAAVERKRARRKAYMLANGEIPMGWTPPDPNDARTSARAWGSYQQRRGTFCSELYTHDRTHSPRRDNPWL